MLNTKKCHGLLLASAAAALFASGAVFAAEEGTTTEAKVHCGGINACKGKSECKSATNACKAQNACKGKGWVSTATEEECKAKGGEVMSMSN